MMMVNGMKLLEVYMEFRHRGAQSALGKVGQGGGGQPSSDLSGAGMLATTIGISINKCRVKAGLSGMLGRNILEEWVDKYERGFDTSNIERTEAFHKGLVYLEEDMRRRRDAERRHHEKL